MNIFHKITQKSLAKNRTRTLVTIIGIVLSMALFTAVIEGAYSGISFLQNCEIEKNGAWHGCFTDMTMDEVRDLKEKPEIDQTAELNLVGWAEIGSTNTYKPYLLVKSAGEGIEKLINIKLVSGRMPKNSSEILLPVHLATNGNVVYELGDTLTISVGTRMCNGEVMSDSKPFFPDLGEELQAAQDMTFSVVGTYERLSYDIESYGCPGYTAITTNVPCDRSSVFFTMKHPQKYYDFAGSDEIAHSELLQLYGSVSNVNLLTLIYGFAGVRCFLIAFGSISLIYNAFSISVSERTKQFGILNSLGATKAQLHSSVLYEALLLDVIAVPIGLAVGCAGIGITLFCLRDAFASLAPSGSTTQMKFIAAPAALILAAVICVLTTLISALIPARRAKSISAMDAIRQTSDVKLSARELKISPLTKKLFGFEGMMAAKQFKRNKKRYRATILSLFLSIVLFISTSSFCSYLKDSVGGIVSSGVLTDIEYEMFSADEEHTPEEIHALLLSAGGVTEDFYANISSDLFSIDTKLVDDSYFDLFIGADKDFFETHPSDQFCKLYFLDDDDFKSLCAENHVDPAAYFDQKDPKALIFNNAVIVRTSEGEAKKWYSYSFINPSKLPCTLYSKQVKELEGYVEMGVKEVDGKQVYLYYPQSYLDDYWMSHDDDSELDESKAKMLSVEEATEKREYTVNAAVEKLPFAIPSDEVSLFYPRSMQKVILQDEAVTSVFAYRSSDHKTTFDEMKKLLSDAHLDTSMLHDIAEAEESSRMMIMVINIFCYGFIILISLIAIANVFNTISTNIALRRREFAMLKSVGLGNSGFRKMMNYECMIYGLKGLLYGLPAAVLVTYGIYRVTGYAFDTSFYIPWSSVAIAVGSVFVVVFTTMRYATGKIKHDNPIEALKNENI